MSEAAIRGRVVKQRWAEPGSAHDRIVRWSKILLPSAVGVLIAVLMLAPLDKHGDVSFILDKKKVQSAPERMRVEAARYTGTDDKGQLFQIVANRAILPGLRVGRTRWAGRVLCVLLFATWIGLFYLGAQPPDEPALTAVQVLAAFYFGYFLVSPGVLRRIARAS